MAMSSDASVDQAGWTTTSPSYRPGASQIAATDTGTVAGAVPLDGNESHQAVVDASVKPEAAPVAVPRTTSCGGGGDAWPWTAVKKSPGVLVVMAGGCSSSLTDTSAVTPARVKRSVAPRCRSGVAAGEVTWSWTSAGRPVPLEGVTVNQGEAPRKSISDVQAPPSAGPVSETTWGTATGPPSTCSKATVVGAARMGRGPTR